MIRTRRPAGFSLLEVVVASAILAVVFLLVFALLSSSADTYAWGTVNADLNGQTRDLLERLSREVSDSSSSSFTPPFPQKASSLTFRRVTGYSGGQLVYGPPITYAFQLDPSELDNGLDDDNDGRIDEGRIVRTEGGQSVALTLNAAKGGFTFTQSFGNTLTIEVTLERLDENRKRMTHTRRMSLQIRN